MSSIIEQLRPDLSQLGKIVVDRSLQSRAGGDASDTVAIKIYPVAMQVTKKMEHHAQQLASVVISTNRQKIFNQSLTQIGRDQLDDEGQQKIQRALDLIAEIVQKDDSLPPSISENDVKRIFSPMPDLLADLQ